MIISYCCQSCDHEFEMEFSPAEQVGRTAAETNPTTAEPDGCPECAQAVDLELCAEEALATRRNPMDRTKDPE